MGEVSPLDEMRRCGPEHADLLLAVGQIEKCHRLPIEPDAFQQVRNRFVTPSLLLERGAVLMLCSCRDRIGRLGGGNRWKEKQQCGLSSSHRGGMSEMFAQLRRAGQKFARTSANLIASFPEVARSAARAAR
jgi:hypothetical protein